MKKTIVIGGMQKHQSIRDDGICPCLVSAMGCGGGYIPLIIERNYEQNIENQTSNEDGICSV